MVMMPDILRRQWLDYPKAHANRANFLVHLIFVPVFMAGTIALCLGLHAWSLATSLAGLMAMGLAMAIQGWGHRREALPPEPFTSGANALVRILLEQWLTFPAYVLFLVWKKQAGLRAGEAVAVEISPVAPEPEPQVPPDLGEALAASQAAQATWRDTTTASHLERSDRRRPLHTIAPRGLAAIESGVRLPQDLVQRVGAGEAR